MPGPPRALALLEPVRFSVERGAACAYGALRRSAPIGGGRPVLVLPGFLASDRSTSTLRRHLARDGFAEYGWGLGRAFGMTDAVLDGVVARLETVHARHGEPVALVGWSFGGVLARWLAHRRPALTRQVVTLGSPWRTEGEDNRARALFERLSRRYPMSANVVEVVRELREPLPVPFTSIYSQSDGVVAWRGCAVDTAARAENVVVVSSHLGLVSNPMALAVVSDRLHQDLEDWRPFGWRSLFATEFGRARTRTLHPFRTRTGAR